MATYTELRDLHNNNKMINKVASAISIYAENIIGGTPTAAQNAWIASMVNHPNREAKKVWILVLAANKDFTSTQITDANDSDIQTQVNAICPVLIDALAGV